MKGFLGTLLVVCALVGAGWYFYDPYIKPLLEGESQTLRDDDALVGKEDGAPAEKPKTTSQKPKAAPTVTPKPTKPAPAKAKPKSEVDQFVEKRYPMPVILPLEVIVDGWKNVPQRAYPKEVTTSETIAFELVVNGKSIGSSNVAPGTPLKPVRLVGDQLTVASLANPTMSEVLPVDKTDFKQRITERYNSFVEYKTNEIAKKRAAAKAAIEKNPDRLAILTGKAPAAADMSGDPRVAPVKMSLKNGEAASVTLEEAKSFVYNGSERVGGEYAGTYETVTVHFEVSTIFGTFPTEYKALLKGGKVFAWIDPITEDRI